MLKKLEMKFTIDSPFNIRRDFKIKKKLRLTHLYEELKVESEAKINLHHLPEKNPTSLFPSIVFDSYNNLFCYHIYLQRRLECIVYISPIKR